MLDHLAWRLEQGYKARSTARFLSGARGFYRFLLAEGEIAEDPTLQVEMPLLGRPLPKSLSEADVEALLEVRTWRTPSACVTAPCLRCSMRAACGSANWWG